MLDAAYTILSRKVGRNALSSLQTQPYMKALMFPGQGAQFVGMGKSLYESHPKAKALFEQANEQLGFRITDVMFEGNEDDLTQTKVAQPAIFLHSVVAALVQENLEADAVAGHSLGEFSALVVNGCLSFESGLDLVARRARAMQKACEANPGTMAAVLGLEAQAVEEICASITDELVVPANYNCPGQLVISGSLAGVEKACALLREAGARRALVLKVAGAFHSPLMEPARAELEKAIEQSSFATPSWAIYQNFTGKPSKDPKEIQENLAKQLTGAVRWTQSVEQMVADGVQSFTEIGPGNVLQGLVRKIHRGAEVAALENA